jgi:Tol biopolymer transport system component
LFAANRIEAAGKTIQQLTKLPIRRLNMKYANSYLSPILALVGLLLATALPACATYPGKNGRIAFIAGPDVYTMNPDGSDVKQLTNLGPDNQAFWESWSPDGKHIVFNEYRAPDHRGQLWLMNADGTNQQLLLADTDFTDERPSFTPNGSSVVFSRCRLDVEACGIYQVGLAGGSPTAITNVDLGIQDLSPQYSSSGSLIFASVARRGIICAIYLKSPDEVELRQLTPTALSNRQPDWSPDGNRIAVSSHCGNPQNEEIWIVDIDRNEVRQLTNNGTDYFAGPHDLHPSWSPQGDAVVFQRFAPDFSSSAIYIMKHDGSGCRKLFVLPNSSRSEYSHANQIQGHLRRTITNHTATQIETGGARPQWGVAPN